MASASRRNIARVLLSVILSRLREGAAVSKDLAPAVLAGVICLKMAVRPKTFYVYLLASRSGTLYIGMTNDIGRRICEHKQGLVPGFTSKYKVHRLVYVEEFDRSVEAIAREKQLKGWSRKRKIALVESSNPTMSDLSSEWLTERPD